MASQAFASPDIYGLVIKHVPEMTKPTDPKYCELKQADNAEIFTICHRAVGGETNLWYLPNDNTATCVINSINICLAMLRNEEVRNAFTEIAASYSQTYPTAWFLQEASPEHKGDMNRVTDGFLQKILEKFPIVWVDNTVENPRLMAAAMRREWDGNFRSCNQCISLNGANVNDTVIAALKAKHAKTHADKKKHQDNHQAFLFMGANSLLHELAHLFITYLSKGQAGCGTPATMKARVTHDPYPNKGEAGRKLEALLFGGTMEYTVDPDKKTIRDDECGAPYLVGENSVGETVRWRILPETIKRTVKCDFKFPYDHEKHEEVRKLEPLGKYTLGAFTDPMTHEMWHYIDPRFRHPAAFLTTLYSSDPTLHAQAA